MWSLPARLTRFVLGFQCLGQAVEKLGYRAAWCGEGMGAPRRNSIFHISHASGRLQSLESELLNSILGCWATTYTRCPDTISPDSSMSHSSSFSWAGGGAQEGIPVVLNKALLGFPNTGHSSLENLGSYKVGLKVMNFCSSDAGLPARILNLEVPKRSRNSHPTKTQLTHS